MQNIPFRWKCWRLSGGLVLKWRRKTKLAEWKLRPSTLLVSIESARMCMAAERRNVSEDFCSVMCVFALKVFRLGFFKITLQISADRFSDRPWIRAGYWGSVEKLLDYKGCDYGLKYVGLYVVALSPCPIRNVWIFAVWLASTGGLKSFHSYRNGKVAHIHTLPHTQTWDSPLWFVHKQCIRMGWCLHTDVKRVTVVNGVGN